MLLQLTTEEYNTVMEDPLLAEDVRVNQGSSGTYLIFHNIDNSTYSSKVLRQAIAAAIDKERLASLADGGTATAIDQFVMENHSRCFRLSCGHRYCL